MSKTLMRSEKVQRLIEELGSRVERKERLRDSDRGIQAYSERHKP